MIEAFVRGDNRPSRDLLAAGHYSSIRAIPCSGQLGTFRQPNRIYERGSIVPKPPRSVAHVAYWKEESEAK